MKWTRQINESETKTIPVELTTREVKLIQNYLSKGKSLNDPANKEAMGVIIRLLQELVDDSQIEQLDTYISNYLHENFGIEVDIDPYGENSAIELGENGLVPLSNCSCRELSRDGADAEMVQGGFWGDDGRLEEGFISVEDLNEILKRQRLTEQGVQSIQLKQEGDAAKLLLTFD